MASTKKRKIAFVGSECYPFVKTGGLGDVMYALPRALVSEGCEVRVIIPLYACIFMISLSIYIMWFGNIEI